jgi:hypothetical protein
MIYCVVPEELGTELYDQLSSYYAEDTGVSVIVDRRKSERRSDADADDEHRREVRDRRRPRVPGEFPPITPE